MYLSQEYLKRHGLSVNHAVYDESVNIVLRSNNFQWLVLHGDWRDPTLHPGYYVFQMYKPVHNACENRHNFRPFEPITDQSIVYWDEFERFIDEWVKKCKLLQNRGFKVIDSQKEAELVCWEMFLYIYDKWLAENMDGKFFDLVLGSTLPDVPLESRRDNFLYASDMLEDFSLAHSALFNTVLRYAEKKYYSEWLAKLTNTNP